ncbi:MAG: hypothetical protein H6872_06010 [Methylobacteriaceae bacterium]|nr:hypothetical protein [Methylobacteriaceae bacterium]
MDKLLEKPGLTPTAIYFAIALVELLLLSISIRTGWVSLSLSPDAIVLGEILAAALVLPSFAAISFANSHAIARYVAFFAIGVPLAGLDLTLLAFIRPIPV